MKLILVLFIAHSCLKKESIKNTFLSIKEVAANYKKADKEKLFAELREMEKTDQLYRGLFDSLRRAELYPYTKTQIDSMWGLQEEIDEKNTIRLLELTEKYGMLTAERMGEKINPFFVFIHADEKHCDRIMRILDRDSKWIEPVQYIMMEWNLNGRGDLPFTKLKAQGANVN